MLNFPWSRVESNSGLQIPEQVSYPLCYAIDDSAQVEFWSTCSPLILVINECGERYKTTAAHILR